MAKTTRTRSSGGTNDKQPGGTSPARRRTAAASRPDVEEAGAGNQTVEKPRAKKGTRRMPSDVQKAIEAALDKKAQDLVVLDLRNTPAFTDFFVICSGLNQRQVKAIADSVEQTLRGAGVRPAHTEGYDRADWILMDFFSFIVHVFTPQTRAFYALERLWGDAERVEVPQGA